MTTPTKRSAKARILYCLPMAFNDRQYFTDHAVLRDDAPFLIIPVSDDDIHALTLKAHDAIASDPDNASIAHHKYLDLVGTVFKAIGLTPAKKA